MPNNGITTAGESRGPGSSTHPSAAAALANMRSGFRGCAGSSAGRWLGELVEEAAVAWMKQGVGGLSWAEVFPAKLATTEVILYLINRSAIGSIYSPTDPARWALWFVPHCTTWQRCTCFCNNVRTRAAEQFTCCTSRAPRALGAYSVTRGVLPQVHTHKAA
eukprot:3770721-Rhodomonas_salina.1